MDVDISHFQCSFLIILCDQGRRASRCSALAPGYYISRLRRWLSPQFASALVLAPICFGAGACPHLRFGAGALIFVFGALLCEVLFEESRGSFEKVV